jgi:hypothetical protein
MFKRTRDKIPQTRKKTIQPQVWQEIQDRADCADAILNGKKFKHFWGMVEQSKSYATETILYNRVLDTKEVHSVSDNFKKIFFTPKQVQVDELVGQIKLIKQLEDTLQGWLQTKRDFEAKMESGEVEVET